MANAGAPAAPVANPPQIVQIPHAHELNLSHPLTWFGNGADALSPTQFLTDVDQRRRRGGWLEYVYKLFSFSDRALILLDIFCEIKMSELCIVQRFPYWPTVSVKIRRARPTPPCNDRPHQHVKLVFVFCYMRSRKVSASSSPLFPPWFSN